METIQLENGMMATLTDAGKESERISMFQVNFCGHIFTCLERFRERFEAYLESIKDDEVEVTFLHSLKDYESDPGRVNGHKARKRERSIDNKLPKKHFIMRNWTIVLSTADARLCFEDHTAGNERLLSLLPPGCRTLDGDDIQKAFN